MTRTEFRKLVEKGLIILDGATGTELAKQGLPKGVCPEIWVKENPQSITNVQKSYRAAGSDIVYTCTFGANPFKLEEFGARDKIFEINKELAEISRKAIGNGLAFGDIAPTGKFVAPFGEIPFDEVVNGYKEQIKGLLAGGVDGFVIETMMDIQEARAALIAVRESCDLPVMVSMTYGEDGRTLTGTDPVTALITLQSLGADAVGCNCSTGPKDMIKVIKKMKPYAKVPLLAKPNAGVPRLINGKTTFDMGPEEYGTYISEFIEAGVNILGGCCGTTPDHIAAAAKVGKGKKTTPSIAEHKSVLSSGRKSISIGQGHPLTIVGERINPTGKKALQADLREGKTTIVKQFAVEQTQQGATVLDVNMGLSGIDEKEMMLKSISLLSQSSELPLCIDSTKTEVVEAALRLYPGRALVNSISGEKDRIENMLPIAAKYGAMIIALPLNDEGIPKTTEERTKITKYIVDQAKKHGYTTDDIAVDGLLMPISSAPTSAKVALDLIEWSTKELGCNTICGLSNISFGLPQRKWVNSTFLAMAAAKGLSMAIANPSSELLMATAFASDALIERDAKLMNYVNKFKDVDSKKDQPAKTESTLSPIEQVFNCVLSGDEDQIEKYLNMAIEAKIAAKELVDNALTPAITKVGELFDKKEYFLPQLIMSANTMSKGFNFLEPHLKTSDGKSAEKGTKIVFATVKGDIHDIGKNIVVLMLKNHNFDVIDLGKDVSAETIVEEAKKHNAPIIGLSALMTTTMTEMKTVVDLAKERGIKVQFMIGGAVIDKNYADEIGAHYSTDAMDAVRLAKKLTT